MEYGNVIKKTEGRNIIFLPIVGSLSEFTRNVRQYSNGLINGDGGVIYFGVKENGIVIGSFISRSGEDDLRLAVDRTIGSFIPFVPPTKYRLIFHTCKNAVRFQNDFYKVVELKVSSGSLGELYEDGTEKCYLYSKELLGPLMPQEIQELVLLKYQESAKNLKQIQEFSTPFLAKDKNSI